MASRPPQPTSDEQPRRRVPWWLIGLVLLGVAIYVTWYVGQPASTPQDTPAATQEVIATEEAAQPEDTEEPEDSAAPESTAEASG